SRPAHSGCSRPGGRTPAPAGVRMAARETPAGPGNPALAAGPSMTGSGDVTELTPITGATLSPLSEAKRRLGRAVAAEDAAALRELRSRASVIELYQRRAGAKATADDAGEIKVRAERGIGQIDLDGNPRGRPPDIKDGNTPIFNVEAHTR